MISIVLLLNAIWKLTKTFVPWPVRRVMFAYRVGGIGLGELAHFIYRSSVDVSQAPFWIPFSLLFGPMVLGSILAIRYANEQKIPGANGPRLASF